jgi:predicted NBD/HSP70 family sugar kinase
MRNKPSVQIGLLAEAILHIRSRRADSRTGLATIMNLSPSTAGLYIDQLMESKLVIETGLDQGVKGRPKRHVEICPEAGWFAGLEFTADRIRAIRIDFAGKLHQSIVTPMPDGITRKDVLFELEQSIRTLEQHSSCPLLGIGLGVPGIVDPVRGLALKYSFIPDWQSIPLAQTLKDIFAVPVHLENNLRAIALAERWFGEAASLDDYVILGPRSGFGVAIVKNGQLISGAHHSAGEIGLWDWPFGDHRGEMHRWLSAASVYRRLQPDLVDGKLPRDLYRAYGELRSGVQANAAWDEVVGDFARVLGYLQLLLDTKICFLHGPLTGLGETFCNAVCESTVRLMPGLEGRNPIVKASTMGDDAGALGSASLAMEAWLPSMKNS